MKRLDKLLHEVERFVDAIGRWSSWCFPLLIGVILFDVITRRFLVLGSTQLQEFEWHLHTVLFSLCLGFGYLRDAHVRVGLVRDNLGVRAQALLELLGCVVLLIPFLGVTIYFGIEFAHTSFVQGEVSGTGTGLGHRWIIKSIVPLGLSLLLICGVIAALRSVMTLIRGECFDTAVSSASKGGEHAARQERSA